MKTKRTQCPYCKDYIVLHMDDTGRTSLGKEVCRCESAVWMHDDELHAEMYGKYWIGKEAIEQDD